MTWLRSLRQTARSGLRVQRGRPEPLAALRAAGGVAVVVGLSLWLWSPAVAASSAFGAFAAGVATFQRSWRPRPALALWTGAALAVSTFLGYLAASHLVPFMILLAVWAFGAGLAWALGPTMGTVAALTVAVMLVVVTLPTTVLGALHHAALIAVGAVVQAALIWLFPVRRWGRQRDALADAFAAEAGFARRLRQDPLAEFDPAPLMAARGAAVVSPWQARRRPGELHGNRGLAERIRPVLASLADPRVGAAAEGPERDRARELLAVAADVLDAVARAIRHGTAVRVPASAREVLYAPGLYPELTGTARKSATRLIALLGAAVDRANGSGPADTDSTAHLLRPAVRELLPLALRSVRRQAEWDAPVFRHALRLSVVCAAGYLLGTALPLGHGYWAPLTSVMVMRPDFTQTFERGVARLAGTVVGVTLGSAVVSLGHPGTYASAALAVLSVWLLYLLLTTGYVVMQVCVGAYVVFLLSMAGTQLEQTVRDRLLLTLLGGALAMAAYAVFPAWETTLLRERLAEWTEAAGGYLAAVFEAYADPPHRRPRAVRQSLLELRAAGAAWDQAVTRADAEPVRHRGLSRTAVRDADAAVSALGRVGLLVEAHLPPRDAPPVPAAGELAAALRKATRAAARDIRERRAPQWEQVRAALEKWEAQLPADPADEAEPQVLRRGADLLVETLDELAEALRPRSLGRRHPAGGARGTAR
ncbi:FUSC family protein [Actinacidiphila acididurans]|uniref:FUSC family protein n=1 Tax=Actinacidiphila acididurans TaxID=2784346 RepID=A0ABS2U1N4_9ACTN|nr:FUSC family protein [Actinacidiphila acididurans]MBM9509519.1 FUSC family protein [Actinacidiphila acididurans]